MFRPGKFLYINNSYPECLVVYRMLKHAQHQSLLISSQLFVIIYQQRKFKRLCRQLLAGLERYREASHIAEQGLRLDPFNLELKQASEEASRGILKDLMSGQLLSMVQEWKTE